MSCSRTLALQLTAFSGMRNQKMVARDVKITHANHRQSLLSGAALNNLAMAKYFAVLLLVILELR